MVKYLNPHLYSQIDVRKNECDINNFEYSFSQYQFARHSKNFFIFVSPDDIQACNEYLESDPYSMKLNINSDFHERRIECTLELIKEANINTHSKIKIL